MSRLSFVSALYLCYHVNHLVLGFYQSLIRLYAFLAKLEPNRLLQHFSLVAVQPHGPFLTHETLMWASIMPDLPHNGHAHLKAYNGETTNPRKSGKLDL